MIRPLRLERRPCHCVNCGQRVQVARVFYDRWIQEPYTICSDCVPIEMTDEEWDPDPDQTEQQAFEVGMEQLRIPC